MNKSADVNLESEYRPVMRALAWSELS